MTLRTPASTKTENFLRECDQQVCGRLYSVRQKLGD